MKRENRTNDKRVNENTIYTKKTIAMTIDFKNKTFDKKKLINIFSITPRSTPTKKKLHKNGLSISKISIFFEKSPEISKNEMLSFEFFSFSSDSFNTNRASARSLLDMSRKKNFAFALFFQFFSEQGFIGPQFRMNVIKSIKRFKTETNTKIMKKMTNVL